MRSPEEVLATLSDVLDDAGSVPLSCWTREELAAWLCGLQGVRSRVEALAVSATATADGAAVQGLDGLRTISGFVGARTGADTSLIGSDRLLGQWLGRFAMFAEAFAAGRISRRHLVELRRADNARTRCLLGEAQAMFVDAAESCSFDGFCQVIGYWLLAADPDGDEPVVQAEKRSMRSGRRVDAMVSGTFLFDPISGAVFETAIDQEVQRLFDADAAGGVERSHTQRRADALIGLVARGAARPDGTVPGPLLHIVISDAVLADAIVRDAVNDEADGVEYCDLDPSAAFDQYLSDHDPGYADGIADDPTGAWAEHDLAPDPTNFDRPAPSRESQRPRTWPFDPGPTLPLSATDAAGRCELVDGTPIHPRWVLGLLGVATLRRLILGADSEILDLGRAVRDFPRHLKDAIIAAHRGTCANNGCDAPIAWLQTDHVIPWTRNGPTATDNSQPLCRPDNHAKGNRVA